MTIVPNFKIVLLKKRVIKDTLKVSMIIKTSKKVYEVICLIGKTIYSESLFNTLYIEIKYKY